MMTLEEFCKLTAHLDGGLEFLVGGAPLKCLFAMDGHISADDCDAGDVVGEEDLDHVVLWRATKLAWDQPGPCTAMS